MNTETVYALTGWTTKRGRGLTTSVAKWTKMQIPSGYGSWLSACKIAAEVQGIDAQDFATEEDAIRNGFAS